VVPPGNSARPVYCQLSTTWYRCPCGADRSNGPQSWFGAKSVNIIPGQVYGPATVPPVAVSRRLSETSAWTPGSASMCPNSRTAGPTA